MKRYRVRLAEDAELDLVDTYRYIAVHDSVERAGYVLDRLESLCSDLVELAERGHIPPELDRIGIKATERSTFNPTE